MENLLDNYQKEKLCYNVKNIYLNKKNLPHGRNLLLKKESENLKIKNKDWYLIKKQNNTWVNISLKNYRKKDLNNDIIIHNKLNIQLIKIYSRYTITNINFI